MDNENISLNCLNLINSGLMNVKGKSEVKRCLVVPLDDNYVKIVTDDSGRPKAAYLNLTAWVLKNPKYNETHLIKLSLPKEVREKMSEEQKKAMPIIGGIKPVVMDSNTINDSNIPFVQSGDTDDLPF